LSPPGSRRSSYLRAARRKLYGYYVGVGALDVCERLGGGLALCDADEQATAAASGLRREQVSGGDGARRRLRQERHDLHGGGSR